MQKLQASVRTIPSSQGEVEHNAVNQLPAVVEHEDFAVFIRRERSCIDVYIRIDLNKRQPLASLCRETSPFTIL